ncbi:MULTISPECIES: DUF3994 domain-containing protein [Bacillus]|uniref:DUF3994 domain-containing protein n=1 Tax=Bacillus arachidis TaxID=2819290 RepID=A0ABS3P4S0_9BACI|nr:MULTISPECIES: DUF3994 domain-containing protein [Bacillus]MBO1628179.1 DUF3994 domain-containing protein [Bacillus arachidis]SFI27283.1 protein of unknown function [Bacillus sp. 71mf]SFS40036.1 protein of unknown function [Bacillus sp. 103mf]
MKATKLVSLAIPILLLVGCSTEKQEMKPNSMNVSDLKIEKPSTTKGDYDDDSRVQISRDGKELLGEWGSYVGDKFFVGLDFKSDGTYGAYDNSGKTSKEENNMKGKWKYDYDNKQIIFTIEETAGDDRPITDYRPEIKYKVDFFRAGQLKIIDETGSPLNVERKSK